MAEEANEQGILPDTLAMRERRLLGLWAVLILLAYAIGGYLAVRQLGFYRAETDRFRKSTIQKVFLAPGEPTQPPGAAPSATATKVLVGVYLERIGDFSIRDAVWSANFDIWFRWTGDRVDPGKTFRLANGHIDSIERVDRYVVGQERYERYRVAARMSKSLDVSRFPFGDIGLAIEVGDAIRGEGELTYVPDTSRSGYSLEGVPQSMRITDSLSGTFLRPNDSDRGGPRARGGLVASVTHFVYAVLVQPPSAGLFLGMFQALFASVLIALLASFIRPDFGDGRFGLIAGAFFAAVGNNISVASALPPPRQMTLTSMVNTAGLTTITLTVVQAIISLSLHASGRERFSRQFDRVSFFVLLVGYVTVSVLLPLAAR